MAAIRDFFFHKGDKDRASSISAKYLMQQDLRTLELIPYLTLNNDDNSFFNDFILRNPDEAKRLDAATSSSSNERIKQAAELMKRFLTQYAKSKSEDIDEIIKFVEFIDGELRIIKIVVADDVNAFTIFETLNDRGLSLAISDLLKNYLFGLSGERLYEVQSSWVSMFSLLDSYEDKKIITDFLRHFWSSKYKLVREKELYGEIKKSINTKAGAVALCKDFSDYSKQYVAILDSENETWKSYSSSTRKNLQTLNRMGVVQLRPLLLAVVKTFNKANVEKSIAAMISWSVRLFIHGGSGSGTIEDNYCKAAQGIHAGTIKNLSDLRRHISTVIPNNILFANSFRSVRVSNAFLARYYLLTIENYFRKKGNKELFPSDNEEYNNLEHILPQKPGGNWSSFSAEEHSTFHKRLGNMTILSTKSNSDLKSDAFKDKVKVYKKSELRITKDLAKKKEWTTQIIEDRQAEFSKLAPKIWPL